MGADGGRYASFVWSPIVTGAVPARARGRWCILSRRVASADERARATRVLTFQDGEGEDVGPRHYLSLAARFRGSAWRTIGYVPADATGYSLFARATASTNSGLDFTPISQKLAAVLILSASMGSVPPLLRSVLAGKLRHARTMLAVIASSTPPPADYQEWQQCFDTWPARPPAGAGAWPTISALVFQHDPAQPEPLLATEAAIAAQGLPMQARFVTASGWREAAAALPGDYIAILQAGEIIPAHASWAIASELQRRGRPEIAFGDQDRLDPAGVRVDPLFRPEPNRMLMLSGTQTRGAWFIRRDVLLAHAGEAGSAETLRLDLWLRRHEAGHGNGQRIPIVVTHRRDDAEAADPAALAALVDAHLQRTAMPLRATGTFPIVVRCTRPTRDRVAILVPSRLRTALSLRSILSILGSLEGRDCELVVGVSQAGPLDEVQAAAAAKIAACPQARVELLPAGSFNFSQVCNRLAAMTTGQHILLLNDDVSVLEPGWLDEMAAHLADPDVAIVGARLLYPDRSVQHGGVLIGLSGLCDHLHRHLPAGELDPAGRVGLAQELSAVTAACLLVRRSVFDAVEGLDEGYPSAFNDVDFCLRVREAGHRIVYAPAATLMHHELQTYGSHYSGDRASFESVEIARMRRRWAALLSHDPFHNPNLDLVPGREWQPSFPPRFAIRMDDPA